MKKISVIKKTHEIQNINNKIIEYDSFKNQKILDSNIHFDKFIEMINEYRQDEIVDTNIINLKINDVIEFVTPIILSPGENKYSLIIKSQNILSAIIRRNIGDKENMWQYINVPHNQLTKIKGINVKTKKQLVTIFLFMYETYLNMQDQQLSGRFNKYWINQIKLHNIFNPSLNILENSFSLLKLSGDMFIFNNKENAEIIADILIKYKESINYFKHKTELLIYCIYTSNTKNIIEKYKYVTKLNDELLKLQPILINMDTYQQEFDKYVENKLVRLNEFTLMFSLYVNDLLFQYYYLLIFGNKNFDVFINELKQNRMYLNKLFDNILKQNKEYLTISKKEYLARRTYNLSFNKLNNDQINSINALYETYIKENKKDVSRDISDVITNYKNQIANYSSKELLDSLHEKILTFVNLSQYGNDFDKYTNVLTDNDNLYSLICPHFLYKYTLINVQNNNEENIINVMKSKYGMKSEDLNYYCKICGEIISFESNYQEETNIKETNIDIIMENDDDSEETIESVIMSKVINIIQDYVVFTANINIKLLYDTIMLMINSIVTKIIEHINQSKIDTKKDKDNKINLYLALYIFSAIIILVINDKSCSFDIKNTKLIKLDKEEANIKNSLNKLLNATINHVINDLGNIINELGLTNKNMIEYLSLSFSELRNMKYNVNEFELIKQSLPYYYFYKNDPLIEFMNKICDKINKSIADFLPNISMLDADEEISTTKKKGKTNIDKHLLDDIILPKKSDYVKTANDEYVYSAFEIIYDMMKNMYNRETTVMGEDSAAIKLYKQKIDEHMKFIEPYLINKQLLSLLPFHIGKHDKKINYNWVNGDFFDKNGNIHNYNIYIYYDKQDNKNKEIKFDDSKKMKDQLKSLKSKIDILQLTKDLKFIDKKCSICNKIRNEKSESYNLEKVIIDIINKQSFFDYFENRCPIEKLHKFIKDKNENRCKLCGITIKELLTKSNDEYYQKYKNLFEDLKIEQQKISFNIIINQSAAKNNIIIAKTSIEDKQYEIINENITTVSKLTNITYNSLINIGLSNSNINYNEIKNNEINLHKTMEINDQKFRIERLRNYVLSLKIFLNYINGNQRGKYYNIIIDNFIDKYGKKYNIKSITITNILSNYFDEETKINKQNIKSHICFLMNKIFETLLHIYENIKTLDQEMALTFLKYLINIIINTEITYSKPLTGVAKLSLKDSEYNIAEIDDDDYENNNEQEFRKATKSDNILDDEIEEKDEFDIKDIDIDLEDMENEEDEDVFGIANDRDDIN